MIAARARVSSLYSLSNQQFGPPGAKTSVAPYLSILAHLYTKERDFRFLVWSMYANASIIKVVERLKPKQL